MISTNLFEVGEELYSPCTSFLLTVLTKPNLLRSAPGFREFASPELQLNLLTF